MSNDLFGPEARDRRLAAIRAQRGSPERAAQIEQINQERNRQRAQRAERTVRRSAPNVPEPLVAFVDDDDGYLRWCRSHPSAFVLNAATVPTAEYLVLHRVGCLHLTGDLPWTTTDASKICSPAVLDLDNWAMATLGARPDRCGSCQP